MHYYTHNKLVQTVQFIYFSIPYDKQEYFRLSAQNSAVDLFYPILVFNHNIAQTTWQYGRVCSIWKQIVSGIGTRN